MSTDSPHADPPGQSTASAGNHAAFDLLHPTIQRQLYRMRWEQLRPLQVRAIKHLMTQNTDLVLAAATASGKTEAAFLPIFSRIADQPLKSVRAIYVGPLKALINDQFGRLEELCQYAEIPVHSWHGDVSMSRKRKLVQTPGGVLLITPESLESLFVNRAPQLNRLFQRLAFVVIDELHCFLSTERGGHLRSLLSRLCSHVEAGRPQLVGLSATIGDYAVAQRFLNGTEPRHVELIAEGVDDKEVKLRLHAYTPQQCDEESGGEAPTVRRRMAEDMVRHCSRTSNLMFANVKADVEEFAYYCQELSSDRQMRNRFYVHHGSLAAELREDTEAALKSARAATAFCSSTLEMGIDIGSVRMVGQIGVPTSVASLKQRLGRSGRKESDARIMRLYLECSKPERDSDVFDRLHLDLIQSIAVVDLMLGGWTEPDQLPRCDLSTLTQQILSVISQHGGATAKTLYGRLCGKAGTAFAEIEPSLFTALLRSLASHDVIEQTGRGEIILGLVGERLRKDVGFYAAFPTPDRYAIFHRSERLGELDVVPQKGDYLLFAGRKWQVDEVDEERKELYVRPARGWRPPVFSAAFGYVHPRIRHRMREILLETGDPAYLNVEAQSLLQHARHTASETNVCQRRFLPLGPQRTALMTWTGTRIQQTLSAMCQILGHRAEDEGVALVFNLPAGETRALLAKVQQSRMNTNELAKHIEPRRVRKYDSYLSDDLIDICIVRDRLCVDAAREALKGWLDRKA